MTERLHVTTVELDVPFHDVDALGVVWHGRYYEYMEVARTKLLTMLDLDGAELLATGHRFYVIESRCRYAYPLRYRDRVRVTAWLKETQHRLNVAYELTNLSVGRRAARGHTILATTNEEGMLLLETPPVILGRIFR